jgi:hypothetical protein
MSYPILRLDGQYTLQRVITLPNNTGTALEVADIGKPVTLNATGEVILTPAAQATFFGILRSVESDGFVSVDFSGVHNLTTDIAISAGKAVTINNGKVVLAVTPAAGQSELVTNCVALTSTTAVVGSKISVFFLI